MVNGKYIKFKCIYRMNFSFMVFCLDLWSNKIKFTVLNGVVLLIGERECGVAMFCFQLNILVGLQKKLNFKCTATHNCALSLELSIPQCDLFKVIFQSL